MEDTFNLFYNTLDPKKFKYFKKGKYYYVYGQDIIFLPEDLLPNKGINSVKLQEIEQLVKHMLKIKKIPVEEYYEHISGSGQGDELNKEYLLSRRGYPGDFCDFMDICVDESIIPTVFAITLSSANKSIHAAFIRDSKIMFTYFEDDDLFSILFSLMKTENCIQIIYNKPIFERIFLNWGIPSTFMNNQEDSVELLRRYMKINLPAEKFERTDCCIVDIDKFDLPDFNLVTQQGKRLLNRWLRSPSVDIVEIEKRLDLSEAFSNCKVSIEHITDLKRIISKIVSKKISIQEIIKLVQCIEQIPVILSELSLCGNSMDNQKILLIKDNFIKPLEKIYSLFVPLIQEIKEKINFDQNRINIQINEDLLKLEMAKYEIYKEIENEFLKVKKNYPKLKFSNRLFRITRTEYQKDDFENNNYVITSFQKTGVYFVTMNLSSCKKNLEEVDEKCEILEQSILAQIRSSLLNFIGPLESYNFVIALIDIYSAFALKIKAKEYCRPSFSNDYTVYKVKSLFHPLLEFKECIFNDISFDKNLCILTGPNMGGKSTFLKSLSIISLYAQIGCYVPAQEAVLPIFDRIFLRLGAKDYNSRGLSTFMVEMVELNQILRTATSKSLILIDELGRGTSAIDGLSLVLAVKEHLLNLDAKAVIATHFSEVGNDCTLNKRMTVKDNILTYKIEDGVCDTSFGLNVAELANFPKEVILQATQYLNE